MGRRSVACSWIAFGTIWAYGLFVLPAAWSQEPAPVEFEIIPKTLTRSGPPLWSLAVSSDGKWAVSGREDGRALVRDLIQNETRHGLKAHEGVVSAVVFAPSGDDFATAGMDGRIRLWHRESGRLQATLSGHENWITCLAFSPDGGTLASGGYDKTVRLWNVNTGVQTQLFADPAATVRTVAFSPDGETLASAGDEGLIRFWNRKTGQQGTPIPSNAGSLRALAFSPDGQKLLIVPQREKIRIWDLKTQTALHEFIADSPDETDAEPRTALYSPDGLAVIVSTRGGRARIWSTKTGKLLQSLEGHDDVAAGLALAGDGKTLYTAGLDGKIQEWSALLPLEIPLHKLPIAAGRVWAISLSPDGKTLAVGGKSDFVELWDLTTGQKRRGLEGFEGTVDGLEFSADGKLLAAAGWREEKMVVWNTETGEVASVVDAESKLQSVALSPDGQRLAAGFHSTNAPMIFSLNDAAADRLKNAMILNGHGLAVYDIAFSPDGTKVASCSGEWTERKPGRVMIHDALTGAKLAQFDNHTHAVRSLTFTADGSKLLSLSQDGVLKVYEMAGYRESAALKNGLDSRPIASTGGGTRVAVGLQNGNINLWDLERREMERRLQGTDDLFSLAFSRDGSLLFGADGNEFVQIWKLSDGENTLAGTVASWLPRSSSADSPADTDLKETP